MELTNEESIRAFVQGIAVGVSVPNEDHGSTYFHRLLGSSTPAPTKIHDQGITLLVDAVRTICFQGDVERFIGGLMHYQEEVEIRTGSEIHEKIIDSAWELASRHLSDAEKPADRLRLCCVIVQNSSIELSGKIRSMIRQYVRDNGYDFSDSFAENIRGQSRLKEIRDTIAGAIFDIIGPWRIWCLVRKFFLGREPEHVEDEIERQQRIAVLRAKLEGAWIHPIDLNDPSIEKIIHEEKAIYVELMEIDPDFMDWFNRTAPNGRRED